MCKLLDMHCSDFYVVAHYHLAHMVVIASGSHPNIAVLPQTHRQTAMCNKVLYMLSVQSLHSALGSTVWCGSCVNMFFIKSKCHVILTSYLRLALYGA